MYRLVALTIIFCMPGCAAEEPEPSRYQVDVSFSINDWDGVGSDVEFTSFEAKEGKMGETSAVETFFAYNGKTAAYIAVKKPVRINEPYALTETSQANSTPDIDFSYDPEWDRHEYCDLSPFGCYKAVSGEIKITAKDPVVFEFQNVKMQRSFLDNGTSKKSSFWAAGSGTWQKTD